MDKYDELYDELVKVSDEIRDYYDIDKVKHYSVYIWTKEDGDDFGENVFDITSDELVFYKKEHKIIEDALPIIKRIQDKLKEIKKYMDEI